MGFLEAQSSLLMDCVVRKGSTLNSAMNLPFMQQEPSQLTNNSGLIQDPEFESRLAIKCISCNFVLEEYQAANEIIQRLIDQL